MDAVNKETSNTLKLSLFLGILVLLLILLGLLIVAWLPEIKEWRRQPPSGLGYVRGTSELVEIIKVEPGYDKGWITVANGMKFEISNQWLKSAVADKRIRVYSALGVNWVSWGESPVPVVSDDYEPIEGMTEIRNADELRGYIWPTDNHDDIVTFSFCFSFLIAMIALVFLSVRECM